MRDVSGLGLLLSRDSPLQYLYQIRCSRSWRYEQDRLHALFFPWIGVDPDISMMSDRCQPYFLNDIEVK